ncbi:MFS transporter [Streptomyces sp. NTH33]|uniref:MFS transporter n=1 Tax=Streptomyces sp. NTH33 TaxID=1735453 RepID=UPI0021ABF15D|nr:MFS transporter [Streptomyces sp. NTH33]
MTPTPPRSSRRQRALVPVLVSTCMLVAVVSSLGAPLIPAISIEDHVSPSGAQWSLTVTLLVGAVTTPAMGRLGDGPRRRQAILLGLTGVGAGSLLAALPLGFGWLIAGRALQGVGMGLVPLAIATARDALPAERARSSVAVLSLTTSVGVGLGYPLTGLLAQVLGLYAAFWFAAAAAAAAWAAAFMVLPPPPQRPAHRMDVLGMLLLTVGMGGMLLALSQAELWGWSSARLLVLAGVSLVVLAWWVVHESRTSHPLVNVRLIRDRTVLVADLTTMVGGVGMYLLMSSVTRFVQTPRSAGYGFGGSVLVTGLALVPFSAASLAAGRLARALTRRMPLAGLLPLGGLVSLAAMLCFTFLRGSLFGVFVAMALAGLGVGLNFAATPGLIVTAVPVHETGSAMSFNQVAKYIGYSTGSALAAAVLQAYTAPGGSLPSDAGFSAIGALGCGVGAVTALASLPLIRSRHCGARDGLTAGLPRQQAWRAHGTSPLPRAADTSPTRGSGT